MLSFLCLFQGCGDDYRVHRYSDSAETGAINWHETDGRYDGGNLTLSPEPLIFQVDTFGIPIRETLILGNDGTDGLVIFQIAFEGGYAPYIDLSGLELPIGIGVDEAFPVTVTYTPQSCTTEATTLHIDWSSVESPHRESSLSILSEPGSLQAIPDSVNVGRVGGNTLVSSSIELINTGVCPIHVNALEIVDSENFWLSPEDAPSSLWTPDLPVVVSPISPTTLYLSYESEVDQPDSGTLILSTLEFEAPIEIPLWANQRECPVAIASGTIESWDDPRQEEGAEFTLFAPPLATVLLNAEESTDPDGVISGFEWTVLNRPNGSSAPISPDPQESEVSLFLDLAGEYVIELNVIDNDGLSACEPAIINVVVIPEEDIHVQLVWTTPEDPTEGDGIGTDLDLHLLRLPGRWDNEPNDCHWKNMSPDWGVEGEAGDPSLDIDDVDELGPENINLSDPEEGVTYSIGVFYYDDLAMNASYATVRVYIDGTQVFEIENRELVDSGVFWEVGRITWPTTWVEPIDFVTPFGFPLGRQN